MLLPVLDAYLTSHGFERVTGFWATEAWGDALYMQVLKLMMMVVMVISTYTLYLHPLSALSICTLYHVYTLDHSCMCKAT